MTTEEQPNTDDPTQHPTATPRPVETELKYEASSLAAGYQVIAANELAGLTATAPIATARFKDRYLDTADGALARAGFAARLRTSGGRTIVSVKSTTPREQDDAGPHRREELEGPAGRVASPRSWPVSDARSVVLEISGDAPLLELLTIRQRRQKRVLNDETATIELSLDEVEVVSGSQVVDRWVELEAELLKGDERRLLDVAEVLAHNQELSPARTSKLERALAGRSRAGPTATPTDRMADGHATVAAASDNGQGPAVRATPRRKPVALPRSPGVLAEDHVAEAGRKIIRFHFARMLAREAGTREGIDPEELHAMRVATRRMRAGWRIFGWAFRGARTKRLRDRLREVAGRLGAVRDLDVLLDGLEAYRADLPAVERRAIRPLVAAWRRERDDARRQLMRELDSDAYARLVEELRDFVDTEGMAVRDVPPTEPHHVRDTAPSRLWEAYERIRSYETVLRWADVETLHQLRIAGKWLRYSLEFVREPLGPDAEALIPPVVALQDHLGLMHDADVSAGMARRFLVERSGSLSELQASAIGRFLVSREREAARLKRRVGVPWRGVAGLAYRRRLGRAVANL